MAYVFHTGLCKTTRIIIFPCAMALRLTSRSSRRRIPFCHRRQRIEICLGPVGPTRLRWLDISNGCQNHTTSPHAAPSTATPTGEMPTEVKGEGLETPVVCATLDHSRENPPCDHDRA